MNKEAIYSSETSVFQRSTERYIPDSSVLQNKKFG
jgi:hypothetical protein